jgi:hypothetical protein
MNVAYLIPDRPQGVPRAFISNLTSKLEARSLWLARGIALGGDTSVKRVEFSVDGANTWGAAKLGSFRRWERKVRAAHEGRPHFDGRLHQQQW